jgi:hypothetical protein
MDKNLTDDIVKALRTYGYDKAECIGDEEIGDFFICIDTGNNHVHIDKSMHIFMPVVETGYMDHANSFYFDLKMYNPLSQLVEFRDRYRSIRYKFGDNLYDNYISRIVLIVKILEDAGLVERIRKFI